MTDEIQSIVNQLNLVQHPEGGYYRQTYRAEDIIISPQRLAGKERSVATGIYYLLESNSFSAWHRFKSDEIWFYHKGSSVSVYMIDDEGHLVTHKLGDPLIHRDSECQVLVKAHTWFAAEVDEPNSFALASCYVAPGFEFEDFELGRREELSKQFPQCRAIINRLTREDPAVKIPDESYHL